MSSLRHKHVGRGERSAARTDHAEARAHSVIGVWSVQDRVVVVMLLPMRMGRLAGHVQADQPACGQLVRGRPGTNGREGQLRRRCPASNSKGHERGVSPTVRCAVLPGRLDGSHSIADEHGGAIRNPATCRSRSAVRSTVAPVAGSRTCSVNGSRATRTSTPGPPTVTAVSSSATRMSTAPGRGSVTMPSHVASSRCTRASGRATTMRAVRGPASPIDT